MSANIVDVAAARNVPVPLRTLRKIGGICIHDRVIANQKLTELESVPGRRSRQMTLVGGVGVAEVVVVAILSPFSTGQDIDSNAALQNEK